VTYYDLFCAFCGRKVGVFADEVYKYHPEGIFCDGDCWNRHPHNPNRFPAKPPSEVSS
jgi:hypothetical protein